MKVSDYIAAFIHKQGIHVVFEMAGGMITHMLDSIANYEDIKIVSMHHEQAASFAADAYGRPAHRTLQVSELSLSCEGEKSATLWEMVIFITSQILTIF